LTGARVAFCHLVLFAAAISLCPAQNSSNQEPDSKSPSATEKESDLPADRVILKAGGAQITREQFESTIGDLEPKGDPDKGESVGKGRRRMGDDYASVLMLSQQAVANHLDANPEIQHKLDLARLQILSDAEFNIMLSQAKPTPEEMKRYYDAHLSDFDRVQIRRLFIWKVGGGSKNTHGLTPEEAKARAAAILQSTDDGDPFRLAQAFKDSESGIFDAQNLTFLRGQLAPSMEKAAFSMKPARWTIAEDTPDRLVLIYLAARDRETLPEVSSLVEKLVQGEKMQAKLDEMKKKSGIWLDESYFGSAMVNDLGEHRPDSKPFSETGNSKN